MSRRRGTADPAGPGITALLAAAVPREPFTEPNPYYQIGTSGKLHAGLDCASHGRRGYPQHVLIDLSSTADAAFCRRCVTRPTRPDTAHAAELARRILTARQKLTVLRAQIKAGAAPLPGQQHSLARALAYLIGSVYDSNPHPALAAFASPVRDEITALLAEHDDAGRDERQSIIRQAILEVLGRLGTAQTTPENVAAPVSDPDRFPALCTDRYSTANRDGHNQSIAKAWSAWRAELAASGRVEHAAAQAETAGTLRPDDIPAHLGQLPRTSAALSHAAGTSPWDVIIAEWRHAAARELTAVIGEWGTEYQAAVEAAERAPRHVMHLASWNLETRTAVNASTALLATLDVVTDIVSNTGLVIVPAPVAAWLTRFGTCGANSTVSWGPQTGTVVDLGEIGVDAGRDMLQTAFRLWSGPPGSNRTQSHSAGRNTGGIGTIAAALRAADGIHTVAD